MPSRSSSRGTKHWRGDSRRKNSSYYQRRPREEVNMEGRDGSVRPQYLLSSNVWVRPEAEQLHSPSICLQIFHENERPSHAYERPVRDVPREEAVAESLSFGQWISHPDQGGRGEGWRDYSNGRTDSWSSKNTCGRYPRGRRNYERYFPRRESYHDEFSSPEHNDTSRDGTPYSPEYLPDMRVKQRLGFVDPRFVHEDTSFRPPRFRSEEWADCHSADSISNSGVGRVFRNTWLRDCEHVGVDRPRTSENVSLFVHPETHLRSNEAETVSSSLAPPAAPNGFSALKELDSEHDVLHVPERRPHMLVKRESGVTRAKHDVASPSAVEKMASDIDNIFRTLVTSPPGADRRTWLNGCSAKGLETHSSGPNPVADVHDGDAKTMSSSFVPEAAPNCVPKTEVEVDSVTISGRADDAAQQLGDRPRDNKTSGAAKGEFSFNVPVKDENGLRLVMLIKDQKPICRTWCGVPLELPPNLNVGQTISRCRVECLPMLTNFPLHPAYEDSFQRREWGRFMNFLLMYNKIGVARFDRYEIYILPPDGSLISGQGVKNLTVCTAKVAFRVLRDTDSQGQCNGEKLFVPDAKENVTPIAPQHVSHQHETDDCAKGRITSSTREAAVTIEDRVDAFAFGSDASVKASSSGCGVQPSVSRGREVVAESKVDIVKDNFTERNFVRTDPSYLKTLGQSHSSWVFGAIAELVDNARDAEAAKLNISVETIFYKKAGGHIPVLSIKDDGHGMTHQEICGMVSFGQKQPEGDDPERIGRFGIGFKTGAMRLGKDALVLTQTAESRSIAFLSQSFNEGRDNLEIPIVSYRRQGQYMELDKEAQSEESAEYNLRAIKEFSPFNEYMIGQKAADFHDSKTGTQIYIWNLEKWGSDYCLEWQSGKRGGSSFYQGDIFIRSRRVRSRPGQTSRKVPLDYSLKAYMEVIFLDPRMKIYVQDSLVKSRPLAKSLGKTSVITGDIMGKAVQLTLGRCQLEWEQANGGIFLYWHGRLIEAYKRVGTMLHNADMGRGVLGVIDVTTLMDDGRGCVYVHNNKQGFQDCEPYALLEDWLADRVHEYWDTKFDVLEVQKPDNGYEPDCQWVQCDKCRKWRILRSDFDCRRLPPEWFCFMEPFNGRCDIPEQKVGDGVITISAKRGRCGSNSPGKNAEEIHHENASPKAAGNSDDALSQNMEDEEKNNPAEKAEVKTPLKRLRRGGRGGTKKKR